MRLAPDILKHSVMIIILHTSILFVEADHPVQSFAVLSLLNAIENGVNLSRAALPQQFRTIRESYYQQEPQPQPVYSNNYYNNYPNAR